MRCLVTSLLLLHCGLALATPPDWDLEGLARRGLTNLRRLPNWDADGYGELAWGTAYGMWSLNTLYEATGDIAYLRLQAQMIKQVLDRRDSVLATRLGAIPYQDFQRQGRVLKAWGTSHYSDGKHTCWAVHAGMLLYPMAEYVRLVRAGGIQTAALRPQAEAFLPEIEAGIKEFDAEWRDGPQEGMGYYVFPEGQILPNNMRSIPGLVLFSLYEVTGKPEYLIKARQLTAFLKTKIKLVTPGDYYVWAYSQGLNDSPGSGEDISHAQANAFFMYVAWQHGASFDDTDMARLTRTFTVGLNLGSGQLSGFVGARAANDTFTPQAIRWGFLARFDPAVEQLLYDYAQAHPQSGRFGSTTGALGYAYLLQARKLRTE